MLVASEYSGDLRQLSANIARARSKLGFTADLSAGAIMNEIANDEADYLVDLDARGNILAFARFSTKTPKYVEAYSEDAKAVIRNTIVPDSRTDTIYVLELSTHDVGFINKMSKFFEQLAG